MKVVLLLIVTTVALVAGYKSIGSVFYGSYLTSKTINKHEFVTELVKPAERYPSLFASARCNDGTPFAFVVEKPKSTPSDTWVIYLHGGAYCDDNSFLCKDRSIELTTTLRGADGSKSVVFPDQGIFNHDSTLNPTFYNVNKVFAHYCSSDVWTGVSTALRPNSASDTGWYFSGKTNVEAMFEVLKQDFGLADTNEQTKIVFTGSSAGCFGVMANAENVTLQLPTLAKDGRLMLVADSCFVPKFENPEYPVGGSTDSLPQALSRAYTFWGSSINAACETDVQSSGAEPARCFLGSTLYPYLTGCDGARLCLPLLIQESSIDHWFVTNHGINPDSKAADPGLVLWQEATLSEFKTLNPSWIFSGGDHSYHTLLLKNEMWTYSSPDGYTFGSVLKSFYESRPPQQVVFGDISAD